MKAFAATEPDLGDGDVVALQVRNARGEFLTETKMFRQRVLNLKSGQVDIYWAAKKLDSELALALTRLDIEESLKRQEIVKQVTGKMAALIPPSLAQKMSLAEASPGEIVLRLIDVQAENAALANQIKNTEIELHRALNAKEMTSIACANAEAGAELSRCEAEALDDLGLDQGDMRKFSQSDFGMGYFRNVLSEKRRVSSELTSMQSELSRMRGSVRQAVNVAEKTIPGNSTAGDLLRECESIARQYCGASEK